VSFKTGQKGPFLVLRINFWNILKLYGLKLVMSLGQKCLTWVGSFFSLGQPPLGLGNFPYKRPIFQIFNIRPKNLIGSGLKIPRSKTGWTLIYCRPKVCSGQDLSLAQTCDGSRSKIFDLGWVGSIFCGSSWVSHLWFGFEFGKFPLKMSNFSIFSLRVKKNIFGSGRSGLESYFLWAKSMLGSGPITTLTSNIIENLHC